MVKRLLFILSISLFTGVSCHKDHDHDLYPNGNYYYYYNGVYYSDPYYNSPYSWDANHYYSGRIEWKGTSLGHVIVLKENPYYGMICKPKNLYYYFPNPYDGEVMVRFYWLSEYNYNGQFLPYIEIRNIYYK